MVKINGEASEMKFPHLLDKSVHIEGIFLWKNMRINILLFQYIFSPRLCLHPQLVKNILLLSIILYFN